MFFVSGAVALVYQVVWQRQFALVFGAAAPATAAVLAAFFAGLALGSVAFARTARRSRRPLRVYAWLEVGVGLGALAVAPLLAWLGRGYPTLVERWGDRAGLLVLLQGALALGTLALPTFCMGGTLPVLARWMDGGRRRLGVTAGRLYAANTLGAALGTVLVPFALLPGLGAARTVLLGALANGCVATMAWLMDRRAGEAEGESGLPTAEPVSGREGAAVPGAWAVGGVAWLSGVVIFALQVAWNRAFALVHSNSVHSFAVIAAVFILALAIGAEAVRHRLRRGDAPWRLLGFAWLAGGSAGIAGPWLFLQLTGGLALVGAGGGGSTVGRLAGLAAAVLLVPVALLGFALPALMELVGRDRSRPVAAGLARLLAVNLAGCGVGAVLAGFVLPSRVGVWGTVVLPGVIAVGTGAGSSGSEPPERGTERTGVAGRGRWPRVWRWCWGPGRRSKQSGLCPGSVWRPGWGNGPWRWTRGCTGWWRWWSARDRGG